MTTVSHVSAFRYAVTKMEHARKTDRSSGAHDEPMTSIAAIALYLHFKNQPYIDRQDIRAHLKKYRLPTEDHNLGMDIPAYDFMDDEESYYLGEKEFVQIEDNLKFLRNTKNTDKAVLAQLTEQDWEWDEKNSCIKEFPRQWKQTPPETSWDVMSELYPFSYYTEDRVDFRNVCHSYKAEKEKRAELLEVRRVQGHLRVVKDAQPKGFDVELADTAIKQNVKSGKADNRGMHYFALMAHESKNKMQEMPCSIESVQNYIDERNTEDHVRRQKKTRRLLIAFAATTAAILYYKCSPDPQVVRAPDMPEQHVTHPVKTADNHIPSKSNITDYKP